MTPVMQTTLTLKDIPEDLYEALKASAEIHCRSLNHEALVCLESVLLLRRIGACECLARARALRAALPKGPFKARDIDVYKREGRR